MADFNGHLIQAKKNLKFLEELNSINNRWDWKVTVCFYTAVHLVNAHIWKKINKNFLSHGETKKAINPYSTGISPSKFNEEVYLSYVKLQNLSRRSRYLCKDSDNPMPSDDAQLTYDVHYKKALLKLNHVLVFFSKEYDIEFDKISVVCPGLENLEFIETVSKVSL